MGRGHQHSCLGASLIEAVIAAALLATVLTGVAPLVTTAVLGTSRARTDLLAGQLARQRLAQLQALTHIDASGIIVADLQSRLADDSFAVGGSGLSPTGLGPLTSSVSGWSDWLDARGAWLSGDAAPPPGARYRRRWAVLAGPTSHCVQVWVEVAPLPAGHAPRPAHAGALQCAWGAWP